MAWSGRRRTRFHRWRCRADRPRVLDGCKTCAVSCRAPRRFGGARYPHPCGNAAMFRFSPASALLQPRRISVCCRSPVSGQFALDRGFAARCVLRDISMPAPIAAAGHRDADPSISFLLLDIMQSWLVFCSCAKGKERHMNNPEH